MRLSLPQGTISGVTDLVFDRVVSEALLEAIQPGGDFDTLVERRNQASTPGLDVQLRRDQRGSRSWASLMLGLTNVLDLFEQNGSFWLRVHRTHQDNGGFDPAWQVHRPRAELQALRAEVQGFQKRAGVLSRSRKVFGPPGDQWPLAGLLISVTQRREL